MVQTAPVSLYYTRLRFGPISVAVRDVPGTVTFESLHDGETEPHGRAGIEHRGEDVGWVLIYLAVDSEHQGHGSALIEAIRVWAEHNRVAGVTAESTMALMAELFEATGCVVETPGEWQLIRRNV